MTQSRSGRIRQGDELYQTPIWVVSSGLCSLLSVRGLQVTDPCCGPGKMTAALEKQGATVFPSDLRPFDLPHHLLAWHRFDHCDWLKTTRLRSSGRQAIIMNPPYGEQGRQAEAFLRHGLLLMKRAQKSAAPPIWMAALLRADFDAASTRADLFRDCADFAGQITLTRRIEWFARPPGARGPSENHAWFLWSVGYRSSHGDPVKRYAPGCAQRPILLQRQNA